MGSVLLEREDDRYDEACTYGLTLLLTGLPLRYGLDHTDSFLVECGVYALVDLYSGSRSVTLYDEAYHDLTLDTCILSALRVAEVVHEVLTKCIDTTRELCLLFYDFEDFFGDFFSRSTRDVLRPEGEGGRQSLVFVSRDERRLLDLDIVAHDLKFIRELDLRLLRSFLWLRFFGLLLGLLFLDEEGFFEVRLIA